MLRPRVGVLAADDIVGVLKKIAANEQSIQTRDL
jgi:hypothetical protein